MTPAEYFAKATEPVHKCNLCGSSESDWATLAVHDRFYFPVRTLACVRCGLTFISPRMSAADYGEFYRTGEYRRLVREHAPSKCTLAESQQNYGNAIADFLGQYCQMNSWRGNTLLDIGGSTGIIAGILASRFGLVPTVVDLAESELEVARANGIEAIYGSAETFEPSGKRWNIVAVLQSIDHFLDPMAVLDRIRESIVAPGGLLLIDAVDILHRIMDSGHVEGACKLDHPFGLTDDTMRSYLEQTGFHMLQRGTIPGKCFYVCRRDLPRRGTLPLPESVIRLFSVCHKVRLVNASKAVAS